MIVFDVTDPVSFAHVQRWASEIERYAGATVQRVLVGTKCDAVELRRVTPQEAQEFADREGLVYIETSAKSCHNVEELFTHMAGHLKTAHQ
uniref:Uncharacterized protein n=1 Tax=Arcella intermedia TaxID=1963864 RepID=A0A6B2LTY9_9EUKA